MYVRRSARVALLDPGDAVLLLRSRFRRTIPGAEWAWFLPGGGVEVGEDVRAAAVREVAEETGIQLSRDELTYLGFSEGHGTVGELTGSMRDDIFVASRSKPQESRSPTRPAEAETLHSSPHLRSPQVSTSGMEAREIAALDRHRWWDLTELRQTSELVFPARLAEVLQRFTTTSPWTEPAQFPW